MEGWGSVARVALTKVGDELISQGGSPPSHTILEWFSASQLVAGLKWGGGISQMGQRSLLVERLYLMTTIAL